MFKEDSSNLKPGTAVTIISSLGLVTGLDFPWSRMARKIVSGSIRVGSSILVATPETAATSRARCVSVSGRRTKAFLTSVVANHRDGY